jgi:hypothetical protein
MASIEISSFLILTTYFSEESCTRVKERMNTLPLTPDCPDATYLLCDFSGCHNFFIFILRLSLLSRSVSGNEGACEKCIPAVTSCVHYVPDLNTGQL